MNEEYFIEQLARLFVEQVEKEEQSSSEQENEDVKEYAK